MINEDEVNPFLMIESDDGRCPYCGYDGSDSHYHCPKCGQECSMMGHYDLRTNTFTCLNLITEYYKLSS
jgi:DNA-directed RNA polymerase subunit RPC12/RpoP